MLLGTLACSEAVEVGGATVAALSQRTPFAILTPVLLITASKAGVGPSPTTGLPAAAPALASPGVRNSKHDFSHSSGTQGVKNSDASQDQLCVYCHTPHRSASPGLLWARAPSAETGWAWGQDLDGAGVVATSLGTPLPRSIRPGSRRCLGCHDGSIALGEVANAGGGAPGVISGLEGLAGLTDGAGRLTDASHLVGVGGSLGGNHPVSVPYPSQTYNGVTSRGLADGAIGNYYPIVTGGCTSSSGICTGAPTSDGRNGAAINLVPMTAGDPSSVGVECSTCHEPHNTSGNAYFTRVDVTNASGLCRSCHNM